MPGALGGLLLLGSVLDVSFALVQSRRDGRAAAARAPGKYFFVAGLEGTGHHFWARVAQRCIDSGACEMRDFAFSLNLHLHRDQVDNLSEDWARGPKPTKAVFMNALVPSKLQVNMMSYPYLGDWVPRLPVIMEAARRNGDELKVLVMLRNGRDVLAGSPFYRAESTLAAMVGELLEQLSDLPAESFRCVEYEKIPELQGRLAPFLNITGFDVEAAVKETFKPGRGCSGHHTKDCERGGGAELDRRFRELREFCGPRLLTP